MKGKYLFLSAFITGNVKIKGVVELYFVFCHIYHYRFYDSTHHFTFYCRLSSKLDDENDIKAKNT
ncbi:hypothetical protein BSU04nite_07320 [Bacillus spizizenii]|nr:hypothetical protein BSU04nite_07320 [Bacillus spizizenii]